MSHTEVYDHKAAERALINEVNRAVRHCRVGRVKYRGQAYPERGPFDFVGAPHLPANWKHPYIGIREWWEKPYTPSISTDRTTPVSGSPRIGEGWC